MVQKIGSPGLGNIAAQLFTAPHSSTGPLIRKVPIKIRVNQSFDPFIYNQGGQKANRCTELPEKESKTSSLCNQLTRS